jgi:hypothetical protein
VDFVIIISNKLVQRRRILSTLRSFADLLMGNAIVALVDGVIYRYNSRKSERLEVVSDIFKRPNIVRGKHGKTANYT